MHLLETPNSIKIIEKILTNIATTAKRVKTNITAPITLFIFPISLLKLASEMLTTEFRYCDFDNSNKVIMTQEFPIC